MFEPATASSLLILRSILWEPSRVSESIWGYCRKKSAVDLSS